MTDIKKTIIKKQIIEALIESLGSGDESFFAMGDLQTLTQELTDLTDQLLNADTTGEKEMTAAKIFSKKDDFSAALDALNKYIGSLPSDSGIRTSAPAPEKDKSSWSDADKSRGYQLKPWMESQIDVKRTIKDIVLQEMYVILNGLDNEDKFLRESEPVDATQDRQDFAATAAEEAAIINQQINAYGPDQYGMVMALSTDQAHWDRFGIHTGEDLAKEMLLSTYSDLYKEFHGFRPRGGVSKDMSVDEINQAIIDLEEYIDSYHQKDDDFNDDPEPSMEGGADPEPQDHDDYEKLPTQTGMGRRGE